MHGILQLMFSLVITKLDFLIKVVMTSMQDGCTKVADSVLAANGESVFGYTVEKVNRVNGSKVFLIILK